MDIQDKINHLGVDTGQFRSPAVPAPGIDMPAENRPAQDELVYHYKDSNDNKHDRRPAFSAVARGCQQICYEPYHQGSDDDFDDRQAHRFRDKPHFDNFLTVAQLAPHEQGEAQDPQDDSKPIEPAPEPEDIRQIVPCDPTERV